MIIFILKTKVQFV